MTVKELRELLKGVPGTVMVGISTSCADLYDAEPGGSIYNLDTGPVGKQLYIVLRKTNKSEAWDQ